MKIRSTSLTSAMLALMTMSSCATLPKVKPYVMVGYVNFSKYANSFRSITPSSADDVHPDIVYKIEPVLNRSKSFLISSAFHCPEIAHGKLSDDPYYI